MTAPLAARYRKGAAPGTSRLLWRADEGREKYGRWRSLRATRGGRLGGRGDLTRPDPMARTELAADAALKRPFVLERDDPMVLGLALRGTAYRDLEIPTARRDPRSVLALLDASRPRQTMH